MLCQHVVKSQPVFATTMQTIKLVLIASICAFKIANCCSNSVFWCARDLEDIHLSGKWIRNHVDVWKYAPTTADLPPMLQNITTAGGIFWAEGINVSYNTAFYLNTEFKSEPRSMFIYVKYYVHITAGATPRVGVFPGSDIYFHEINFTPPNDYQWKEALVEIDQNYAVYNVTKVGLSIPKLTSGQYFLIDTIAIVQGQETEEPKKLCSLKKPITFECINTDRDFMNDNWESFPPYKYAKYNSALPESLRGNVTGSKIFYFEGHDDSVVLYKDYHKSGRLPEGKAFFYLRYMTAFLNHSRVAMHVSSIDVSPGGPAREISTLSQFIWQEVMLPLRISDNLVKIEVAGMQNGDYFLVDKIAVVAGGGLDEILADISSCRQRI